MGIRLYCPLYSKLISWGEVFSSCLKAKLPELLPMIYSFDLEVIARHFLTISSHWKTAMRHSSQQIQRRLEWVVWGDATNHTRQRFQPLAKLKYWESQSDVRRSPMQPQMFILGINMILGFTSKAAQLWGALVWSIPSGLHGAGWRIFVHTIGCTPKAPLARKLRYVEITIANLQKWKAKQVTGDVFPKITCCQCPIFVCTKTTRKGACCTGIWIRY